MRTRAAGIDPDRMLVQSLLGVLVQAAAVTSEIRTDTVERGGAKCASSLDCQLNVRTRYFHYWQYM